MKIMFNDMTTHPAYIIEKILIEEGYRRYFRVSYWMGIYIPFLCVLFLLLIGISIQTGWLK
jgi:hypothetical protein